MSHKPSQQDSWSSLLSELGVGDPIQCPGVAEPVQEPAPLPEPEVTTTCTEMAAPPGKVGKFGMGIVPDVSSHAGAKSGTPKKPEKMSFFDRLASISLFGAGTSEKINTKIIAPSAPETSGLAEDILEPNKLRKVEETPKVPKDENRPKIGAIDPWSKIATQLGVRVETVEQESEPPGARQEETRSEGKPEIDEIPDIELMTSFRDLPPKRRKIDDIVPPARVERVEPVPEPKKTYGAVDSSSRRDRSTERRGPREKRSEERGTDKYVSDKHGRRGKPRGSKYDDSTREELEITPIYDERMDLDTLDLVAPTQEERVPSYSLDGIDDEEMPVLSRKRATHRRSRSRKYEETDRRPSRSYTEPQDELEGGFEEDYEVLTPPPAREYGPPRDVFADLIPENVDSGELTHETQRTRGSKVRGTSFQVAEPPDEPDEESDPFAHFNEQPGRGSRAEQPRRGSRRTENTVIPRWKRGDDAAFDEAPDSRSESSSLRRETRGGGKRDRTVVEPMDEQGRLEEQEMMQLHRNIPGWEDAILPIIENNIAKRTNRHGGGRKGNRSK